MFQVGQVNTGHRNETFVRVCLCPSLSSSGSLILHYTLFSPPLPLQVGSFSFATLGNGCLPLSLAPCTVFSHPCPSLSLAVSRSLALFLSLSFPVCACVSCASYFPSPSVSPSSYFYRRLSPPCSQFLSPSYVFSCRLSSPWMILSAVSN